jgi:G:T-mismatch repair DNA endonuclease (very short patch repair protein)
MADVFTPEQRSALMARIRGRDTRPKRFSRKKQTSKTIANKGRVGHKHLNLSPLS